jgi:1-phosphofructokinase family hexose kinase
MLGRMADFLCVTPNVALDRTLTVPGFTAGRVWRAARVQAAAGGKGINVARALAGLGRTVHAAGLLGGAAGAWIARAVAGEGLAATWTAIAEETRTCIMLLDAAGAATVVNEAGPAVTAEDWRRFCADVGRLASGVRFVALSGSLPPVAVAADVAMTRLIRDAGAAGAALWIDTSGVPLAAAIAAARHHPVAGIKVNAGELAEALGRPIVDAAAAAVAGQDLRAAGVGQVALTAGGAWAVLVGAAGAWQATPPAVAVASPVGAGDSFLAGLLAAVADGAAPARALAFATAAGTANVAGTLAGAIQSPAVAAIVPQVTVRRLSGF